MTFWKDIVVNEGEDKWDLAYFEYTSKLNFFSG